MSRLASRMMSREKRPMFACSTIAAIPCSAPSRLYTSQSLSDRMVIAEGGTSPRNSTPSADRPTSGKASRPSLIWTVGGPPAGSGTTSKLTSRGPNRSCVTCRCAPTMVTVAPGWPHSARTGEKPISSASMLTRAPLTADV